MRPIASFLFSVFFMLVCTGGLTLLDMRDASGRESSGQDRPSILKGKDFTLRSASLDNEKVQGFGFFLIPEGGDRTPTSRQHITYVYYPADRSVKDLTRIAGNMKGAIKERGKILRSFQISPGQSYLDTPQYYLSAIRNTGKAIEYSASRYFMHKGHAVSVSYSRRATSKGELQDLQTWIGQNRNIITRDLFQIRTLPELQSLRRSARERGFAD